MKPRLVVAIPARDEEEHVGPCLQAVLSQCTQVDDIVLLLNNCVDDTRAASLAAVNGFPNLHLVERSLGGAEACAGEARRLALDHAAALAPDAVILTTDADGAAPPWWVKENLAGLALGAEVVCGRAEVKPADAALIPERLHRDHMREVACRVLLDEIDALLNPDPADPWPRHQEHSGASIAMTAAVFRRAGGAPRVAQSEDRVLISRLSLVDASIRHAPDVVVEVSGRLEGRATGGMADTIRRRMTEPDIWTDDTLEPAVDAYRRALAKADCRAFWRGEFAPGALAAELLIPLAAMPSLLSVPYFGVLWAEVQRLSPVLQRRRLAVADLPRETARAAALRDEIRAAVRNPACGREIAD